MNPPPSPLSLNKLWTFLEYVSDGLACYEPVRPIDLHLSVDEIICSCFQMVCVGCNSAYARMSGRLQEEMVGIRVEQFVPDDKNNRANIVEAINGVKQINLREQHASDDPKYFIVNLIPEVSVR